MPPPDPSLLDRSDPRFRHYRSVRRLAPARRGQASPEAARHQLYVGVDTRTSTGVLFKVTSKPGLVYERNLANELASLSTINRVLPDSRYFPFIHDHGRLADGRMFLVTTLFDELPLATEVGAGRAESKLVTHLRTAIEVARALEALHGVPIVHVDLNPMNILHRVERDRPIIRIVDFESSYEPARYPAGTFYDPPTTPRFTAPEVPREAPDARADVYSLGATLYTLLVGYDWTWEADASTCLAREEGFDPELTEILRAAVAPRREDRYAGVHEFRDALARYLELIWPGRSW